ncbi:3-hydroxybutyrate oligomer hydrolase family protein [Candidatus Albibeggiatoa sp. nov. NOAA]|uniref:3-hydroxybutyrate oligomer hydrolase family protein n=1 Tax=Candidatus Albibeggiatoa sp. nov. NOAA TaxID=3162724 RepID=UPI0032F3BED6|nr:D-(-)-3-hydroxybutyrate oligomer hydrolase [Thiotrichaceae bacterium]
MKQTQPKWLVAALGTALLVGCSDDDDKHRLNQRPDFIKGEIINQHYELDADLLTAGAGGSGLASPTNLPPATDPNNPTAHELRKQAIFNNFRALQDTRDAAGYDSLYGPNVPETANDGRITGTEYMAFSDDGSGKQNVVLLVQIPDTFDVNNPCIVTGPSSGSRGIYGAVGTSGEWGLKQGCAVAYTDNGKGVGTHDLISDTVNLIDGTRTTSNDAGNNSHFTAEGDLGTYNSTFPNRIAMKQAHSQQNPEADWGKYVLQSIEFAFYVLNLPENYGITVGSQERVKITPDNTIVIASSVSNGGGASIRAAEQDTKGLIDGVVVSEPNINPKKLSQNQGFNIQQGSKIYNHNNIGRPLVDYVTYYNLYQSCASANTPLKLGQNPATGTPESAIALGMAGFEGRCDALKQAGLLESSTLDAQIAEAQQKLNDYGLLPSSNVIAHTYGRFDVYASIAMLYPNSYGRSLVTDNLCDYSYAYANGSNAPEPKPQALLAADFSAGNGIPPSNSTFLINNNGNNGAGANFRTTLNADGVLDEYLAGALCLRRLARNQNIDGSPLTGDEAAWAERIQTGLEGILGSGNLQGKPSIIIHGRDDALIAVNHSSRYYYGLNQKMDENSQLAYIEVKNAHHLDSFNEAFNMDTQIPLHYYFSEGLDIMYAHLKEGAALPNSQVVDTYPLEETGGDRLQAGVNLPDIGSDKTCPITFENNVLTIPECDNS